MVGITRSKVIFLPCALEMRFAPQRCPIFRHLNFKGGPNLCTRRFSAPTFPPSRPTNESLEKHNVWRLSYHFARACILFLLTLLSCFLHFISPCCWRFDFQTSFDQLKLYRYDNFETCLKDEMQIMFDAAMRADLMEVLDTFFPRCAFLPLNFDMFFGRNCLSCIPPFPDKR